MATTLPNIPFREKILDPSGFLSPAWSDFFRQLFIRIGKNQALSNTELANVQTTGLTALTSRVATLETSVTALQSVSFGVGPYL